MPTDDRITDTMNYLRTKVTGPQYQEIDNLVQTKPAHALSAALSIGHKNPFRKPARRAKRCLMLLAYLFIEDAGARQQEIARYRGLPENNEAALALEINSWFTLPGITPAMVAVNAHNNIARMPNWNNINYDADDAIRGVYDKSKPFNCYNACVFWAFQAGAISKRYLWNKLYGTNGNEFFPIYSRVGWNTIVKYNGTTLVKDDYGGGNMTVPAGLTVYFETPSKVFGHVACSLGDGTVISQNSVIPAIGLGNLDPEWAEEVHKMTRAETHILPIRYLMTLHFHPTNAYPKVKVTNGGFWDPIPLNER